MVSGMDEDEIRIDPEEGRWVSRAELIAMEGVTERTITNRIKQGYYTTRMTPEGRREIFWKRKALLEAVPEDFQNLTGSRPEVFPEDAGIHPETIRKNPETDPESNLKALEIVQDALDRVDIYARELIQAGEERGYYRAITDSHAKTETQLKEEIYRLTAEIKEAGEKSRTLITELENLKNAQLESESLKKTIDALRQENEALKQELEAAKQKPAWKFWG